MTKNAGNLPPDFRELFVSLRETVPGSRPFLVSGGRKWNYGELFAAISRAESLFENQGWLPGDRIVVACESERTVITLFLAALKSGLVFVLIDPAQRGPSLAKLISAAEPKACWLGGEAAGTLPDFPEGSSGPRIMRVEEGRTGGLLSRLLAAASGGKDPDGVLPEVLASGDDRWREPVRHSDELTSLLVFTSGTTTDPKGVEHTRRGLLANTRTIIRNHGFDGGLRQLNVLPLHHLDGLVHGVLATFAAGGTLHRWPRITVPDFPKLLESIRARGITHLMAVPTNLRMLLEVGREAQPDAFSGPAFRYVISGAAPLDVPLWEDFERTFGTPIVNCYGLTETVSQSFFTGPDPTLRKLGTIGKPVDCRTRITDETGRDAPAGGVGELWLAGDCVMKGYTGDPEATRSVFEGPWFRTGDLVCQDPEGFFHLVGRKKEIIIRGGVCLYPDDIRRAVPKLECAVVGRPDPLRGERAILCVEERPGAPVIANEVLSALAGILPPELRPDECRVFAALPRGASGKILLPELRRLVESDAETLDSTDGAPPGPPGRRDVWNALCDLAAAVFQVTRESLGSASTPDNTDGWDSLAHFELVTRLERRFGIRLGAKDIVGLRSLGHAERIIRARLKKD